MAAYGPSDMSVFIFTYKEGVLSPIAHDLKLRVDAFEVLVGGEGDVHATFDPASVRVVSAMVGGQPSPGALTGSDCLKIEDTLRRKVLQVRAHPEVRFEGRISPVKGAGEAVQGRVIIRGKSQGLALSLTGRGQGGQGRVRLDQRAFGIRPYSALFGALRVKPHVDVEVVLLGPTLQP